MPWTRNKLLSCLPNEDADILRPDLEPVTLTQGQVLFGAYETISHIHFFEGGLSSEIAGLEQSRSTEVGCIGFEGYSAVPAVLGVDSTPHHAFMQCGGPALRIEVSRLRAAMDDSHGLRKLLLKYAHVFLIQIAATALADSRYEVTQRLARWVLMSQDRIGDELPLTHDFLSLMLGVRRPSVTDAIHRLEGVQAIKAERSLIVVRDRRKLEEIAGSTYGIPEVEYERHIGLDFRD
ncbi:MULTISPECIES: Crp/Fnr family transcriptional regulator [Rhizobium]|uniref:CRP-like cAMP-binding protein n=1 Tax=Rhizobium wenxiniae TaxID=1737357 RepID=A0A7W9Y9R6_9HYPH|nr:Crp/Fnr family transcriptional regulator [Rhizobium wenxiniae]MBB6164642.1 CRP-like cAMP-binding protein [Rhizobium wenxiniae]GGG06855.1 Crp/Fnr family transcriptional regulator [Rhizobium wenxiniae]